MISLSHIYKTYPGPIHALSNFDLNIEKGESVFITGPSGSGKTTLFRLVSGFDRPSSGAISVAGFNINELTEKEVPYFRRNIGVVFQDFRLLKDRTVFENVALPLEIKGQKFVGIKQKVNEMLDIVGLTFKREQHPEQLSGGEQQRVAIARALIHQPGVLIADEPTGNLDEELSLGIMELLDKVNAQGTTVLIATHDMDLVKKKRRRVIQIKSGNIVKDSKNEPNALG
ncbi:MAG: cell division ATP-binding protein FtsE [Pseudomonadota bacterium]|nr:cell division ATP-binding protein FtsE [Pseudomonadota bacterium]